MVKRYSGGMIEPIHHPVFDLSEIFGMILDHASLPTVMKCRAVCKSWQAQVDERLASRFETFTPLLDRLTVFHQVTPAFIIGETIRCILPVSPPEVVPKLKELVLSMVPKVESFEHVKALYHFAKQGGEDFERELVAKLAEVDSIADDAFDTVEQVVSPRGSDADDEASSVSAYDDEILLSTPWSITYRCYDYLLKGELEVAREASLLLDRESYEWYGKLVYEFALFRMKSEGVDGAIAEITTSIEGKYLQNLVLLKLFQEHRLTAPAWEKRDRYTVQIESLLSFIEIFQDAGDDEKVRILLKEAKKLPQNDDYRHRVIHLLFDYGLSKEGIEQIRQLGSDMLRREAWVYWAVKNPRDTGADDKAFSAFTYLQNSFQKGLQVGPMLPLVERVCDYSFQRKKGKEARQLVQAYGKTAARRKDRNCLRLIASEYEARYYPTSGRALKLAQAISNTCSAIKAYACLLEKGIIAPSQVDKDLSEDQLKPLHYTTLALACARAGHREEASKLSKKAVMIPELFEALAFGNLGQGGLKQ